MLAIDREVRVECHHRVLRMKLRHPDKAWLGEGHRSVAILAHQGSKVVDVLVDTERHIQRAVLEDSRASICSICSTARE
jgi:hypothetical protein